MLVHRKYEGLDIVKPVVTLGVFDGVHRGHLALLNNVVEYAIRTDGESVVVTFDPHPRLVLSKDHQGLSFLTTLREKKKLIENAGINHLIIIRFTREISNLSAYDFIKQVLVDKIGVKHLVVGYDHHFGRGREGDFDTVALCGKKFGFSVEKMEEVSTSQGIVSSTAIREALLAGRLSEANGLLGYSYSLTGKVVEGRRIGHSLGFPTSNIRPYDDFKLIPADGVYAVEVIHEGAVMKGMLSIGNNPTVSARDAGRSIEVNIFDFNREIYGSEITVIFRDRLRDMIRFESTLKLKEQMEIDRQQTLRLLT